MSKHTPGPWVIWNKRAGNGSIQYIQALGADEYLAQVFGGSLPAETVQANGRLIAAAPELLGAIKEFLRCAPAFLETSDKCEIDDYASAIRGAASAIAKAEGK